MSSKLKIYEEKTKEELESKYNNFASQVRVHNTQIRKDKDGWIAIIFYENRNGG